MHIRENLLSRKHISEFWQYLCRQRDCHNLYAPLHDSSDSRLDGHVKNVRRHIGKGNHEVQQFAQEQVNGIQDTGISCRVT